MIYGQGFLRVIGYYVLLFTSLCHQVRADVFTSLHEVERLAQQELRLLSTLQVYVSKQQSLLSLLSTKLDQLNSVRSPDLTVEEIVSDPVNVYTLVRRLTREWPLLLTMMTQTVELQEEWSSLPGEEDLVSAARGLSRLQDVYMLDTAALARETWGTVQLTALDCFEMGKHLLKTKQFEESVSWLKEAFKKAADKDVTMEQENILPYIYLASFYSGCKNNKGPAEGLNVILYLMSQYPDHTLDENSAPIFRQALSSNCNAKPIDPVIENQDASDEFEENLYRDSCRGIRVFFPPELRCFYVHYNNPRLLIAPFKLEELHLDPPLLLFHDVISDKEIADMKNEYNKVRHGCTTYFEGGQREDYYRTCNVGWVLDNATETSSKLTRRVGDMTNLDMETSELNQVASYGLGGEFKLHYDPIQTDNLTLSSRGSRIATLMFYLNDVASGGYTAFPHLRVAVQPLKGSAVFWYNLDHRSEDLESMLHGGCPVLRGSKWVLNKWIHEGKQKSVMFCPVDESFPKPRYYINGIKQGYLVIH